MHVVLLLLSETVCPTLLTSCCCCYQWQCAQHCSHRVVAAISDSVPNIVNVVLLLLSVTVCPTLLTSCCCCYQWQCAQHCSRRVVAAISDSVPNTVNVVLLLLSVTVCPALFTSCCCSACNAVSLPLRMPRTFLSQAPNAVDWRQWLTGSVGMSISCQWFMPSQLVKWGKRWEGVNRRAKQTAAQQSGKRIALRNIWLFHQLLSQSVSRYDYLCRFRLLNTCNRWERQKHRTDTEMCGKRLHTHRKSARAGGGIAEQQYIRFGRQGPAALLNPTLAKGNSELIKQPDSSSGAEVKGPLIAPPGAEVKGPLIAPVVQKWRDHW